MLRTLLALHLLDRQDTASLTTLGDQLQRTFGPSFIVERELDGGGMAKLFVVRDETLGRRIVVKVLPHELAGGVVLERFNREIQLLARLQHPNIVPVLAAGAMDGIPYFTMPFVEGEALHSRLSRESLELPLLVSMLKDVAAALAYAHRAGVVHRDVKPDNVLISGTSAMVTDFGVAKAVVAAGGHATSNALTSIGVVVGTPAYMSPEQASGDSAVDHRADIYSFGAMAYEMLGGRAPFADRTPQSTIAAHIHEKPEPLLRVNPRVPPALADIVMRCLEKSPGARPQSAEELLQLLGSASLRVSKRRVVIRVVGALAAVGLVAWGASRYNTREGVVASTFMTVPMPAGARSTIPDSLITALRAERPLIGRVGDTISSSVIGVTARGDTSNTPPIAMRILDRTLAVVTASGGILARKAGMTNVEYALTARGEITGVRDTALLIIRRKRIPDSLITALVASPVTGWVGDTFSRGIIGLTAKGDTADNPSLDVRFRDTTIATLGEYGKIAGRRAGTTYIDYTLLVRGQQTAVKDSALVTVRPRSNAPELQLARGISLYESFNVVAALPIFKSVAAAPNVPVEERARAYAYLGSALAVIANNDSAVRMLRRAVELDPTIDLDPTKFASAEIGAFNDAKNFALIGIPALNEQTFTPRTQPYQFRVTLIGNGLVRLAVKRAGEKRQHEVARVQTQQGTKQIDWPGTFFGDSIAPGGRYEVLAMVVGVYGAASDTARRSFWISHVRDSSGVRLRLTRDSITNR